MAMVTDQGELPVRATLIVADVPEHMVASPLITAVAALQPPPQVLVPLTTGAAPQECPSVTVKE